MRNAIIFWDLEDEIDGNVQHIAEHDISVDEVESVLRNPDNETTESRSSGNKITFGYTHTDRYITVVWEFIDDDPYTIYPLTAYTVPEPSQS